ncbi:MAG: spore germination protein, partial [Clostridia bacterium]|nr:spore germination protein [Clostridia bacterium]
MKTFTLDYNSNLHMINETLRVGESFDITVKRLKIGGRKAVFYCLNGFVKDGIFEKEMEYLSQLTEENLRNIEDAEDFLDTYITYIECSTELD